MGILRAVFWTDFEWYVEPTEELVRLFARRGLGGGDGHLLEEFAQSAAILDLSQSTEFLLERLVRIEIPARMNEE